MSFLIDTHCHINFNSYKDDWSQVIRRSLEKGIWLINIGSQYDTSKRAAAIAAEYGMGVYAAIGLHPVHLSSTEVDEEEIKFKGREEIFDEKKYQPLIDKYGKKIVAVGEIGLDYWHITKNIKTLKHKNIKTVEKFKAAQQDEFVKQLKFAAKNNLPLILHCRGGQDNPLGAYYDLLKIVKLQIANYKLRITGVLHCYGANLKIAEEFIKLGFYIGFTGIITFGKSVENLREVARLLPLDKILIETDAPYLAPDPHRGERNEPAYVEFIAARIAVIKNLPFEAVAAATTKNAEKLFQFKKQ